jgi:hypothetical protein
LLRGIGVSSANWLPLACDPDVHHLLALRASPSQKNRRKSQKA